MKFNGTYVIGGIESRSIHGLVVALLHEAVEADGAPPIEQRSRHLNTAELQELARMILAAADPLAPERSH